MGTGVLEHDMRETTNNITEVETGKKQNHMW